MDFYPIGITFLALALAAAAVTVLPASAQCDFPAIFNFGDSNSDTGGLSATFGPVPPPYGETFFKKPSGRNSDGRLIVDFMAKSLQLPYLSAYLDSVGTNFSHGANFASAGSTIRKPNMTIFNSRQSPFSLEVQSWEFAQFKPRSQSVYKQGGLFQELLPKEDYFARALYTFDMGQNDLTFGFFHNMTLEDVKAYIPDVMDVFATVLKSVYGEGGRAFWIHNTAPLGCLPYVLAHTPLNASQVDEIGCGIPYNEAAQYFNAKLNETVVQLRKDLPNATLVYVDMYSAKRTLISHANEYGFKLPFAACCGRGGGKYNFDNNARCGATVMVNGTEVIVSNSCKNPQKRISWDGIHFTEAANRWVFNQIRNGSFSDPPLPLNMACNVQ